MSNYLNKTVIYIMLFLFFASCNQRHVKPTWTTEVRWCDDIKFIGIGEKTLTFLSHVYTDTIEVIDNSSKIQEYNELQIEGNENHLIMFLNLDDGRLITNEEIIINLLQSNINNPGSHINFFSPKTQQTTISNNYKGYRISIEVKQYIWRSASNIAYSFLIHKNDILVCTYPIEIESHLGGYFVNNNSIYISWGPIYSKCYISKFNFDNLIANIP